MRQVAGEDFSIRQDHRLTCTGLAPFRRPTFIPCDETRTEERFPESRGNMKILLYNPDNGVTRNFMPHLWMFLLQALTPPGHEVLLVDGNASPMDEAGIAQYVRDNNIGLVGIGAMTRMVAKAYRMADAVRATGVPVVMGGPHVTEMADEALGRDGGPQHADAVALGEADATWPRIVEDAARGSAESCLRAGGCVRAGEQAVAQGLSRHSLAVD